VKHYSGKCLPKKYAGLRIDEELLAGLETIRERDGVTVPEQVRRAFRAWLEKKSLNVKAERKRLVRRQRS
jgi:hypothetical protein